jgi:hypothetical protein
MTYLVDWPLIGRSEQELRRLCERAGAGTGQVNIHLEETGLAWLVTVGQGIVAEDPGLTGYGTSSRRTANWTN